MSSTPGRCSAPGPRPRRSTCLMRHAFDDLGYRRFEWKCDSLNEPSRRAAARLGFTYEGRFRHHMVTKGRNRDTDWFSVTDAEWPAVRAEHERWLDPANFDDEGRQRTSLRPAGTGDAMSDDDDDRPEEARSPRARSRRRGSRTGGCCSTRCTRGSAPATSRPALKLVKKIGKAADKADHHPDVDLSYPLVDVRLSSHDAGGVTSRDIDLARQISGFAADLDVEAAPGRAVGHRAGAGHADLRRREALLGGGARLHRLEGARRGAQRPRRAPGRPCGSRRPTRPRARCSSGSTSTSGCRPRSPRTGSSAALDAGGTLVSDERAPTVWVLADAHGNKACVTTWLGRDPEHELQRGRRGRQDHRRQRQPEQSQRCSRATTTLGATPDRLDSWTSESAS